MDALFDDRPALANVSLVSKTWHQHARQLFFEEFWVTISIFSPKEQAKTDALIEFLESGSSSIARYTEKVCVVGIGPSDDTYSTAGEYAILDSYLGRTLPYLTSAKTLKVRWMQWDRLSTASQALFSLFSQLETLSFQYTSFPTFAMGYKTMYGLVQSQKLKNLDLSSICAFKRSVDTPFPKSITICYRVYIRCRWTWMCVWSTTRTTLY